MLQNTQNLILGHKDKFDLEHRCYNGVSLTAAIGCLFGSLFNTSYQMPLQISATTFFIGIVYLWLYYNSRNSPVYRPKLGLYILLGVGLLIMTWLFNGGINGSDTFISMVALVAMTVVLKRHRFLLILAVFIPTLSALYLLEFLIPGIVHGYFDREQRFLDLYLTFIVSTMVIFYIIDLILKSHDRERKNLDEANRLLQEKMVMLNHSNQELEAALTKVKTLSGLLPICSSCKKIRDDKGYWNQIEIYIKDHSEADFSHGICPQCAKKMYPDLSMDKYAVLRKQYEEDE